MRILTVCVSGRVFGAEVVTLKMLEGFKQVGHEQLAVTSIWTDGEFSRRLRELQIDEVKLPFGMISKKLALRPLWWTFQMLLRCPELWIGWRRLLRSFRPDLVLFTTWRHVFALYPVIGNRPSLLIEHSSVAPTTSRRFLYRLLARKIRYFVTVSKSLSEQVIKAGAPAAKVRVVHNGVFGMSDRPAIECERASFRLSTPIRFGIVGQIAPSKGHDILFNALASLQKRQRRASVYVFGTGDSGYVATLKDKIASLGIGGDVHWMGYQSKRSDIYGQFDVAVVPSLFEDPFPTVALEASAYGRPVIASRIGGLPEIVEDHVTGWLIEPADSAELARKMEDLVEHPEAIRAAGAAAAERVFSIFTQEKMIADLQGLFIEMGRS